MARASSASSTRRSRAVAIWARTGLPVITVRTLAPNAARDDPNETPTAEANLAKARFDRLGIAFCSCSTIGRCAQRAAITAGTLT